MTKDVTIHIRVNGEVKDRAVKKLERLGISLPEAVNMFLHQVDIENGMPFDSRLPAPESVIVNSYEELDAMLERGERDINEGKYFTREEFERRIEEKYGFKA